MIRFTEAGAIDTISPGNFGAMMTITSGTGDGKGASGQVVFGGTYSLSAGSGSSDYQGQVCTAR